MHDYHAEIYLAHHLPDLHDVVFRHRADDPWLIGVPGKVRDLGCVTSVDELDERQGKYINLNAALIIHHHHTVKHMGLSFLFDMIVKNTYQQLWGSIFCIFWRLLLSDFTAK
jgi:hypothetical protein